MSTIIKRFCTCAKMQKLSSASLLKQPGLPIHHFSSSSSSCRVSIKNSSCSLNFNFDINFEGKTKDFNQCSLIKLNSQNHYQKRLKSTSHHSTAHEDIWKLNSVVQEYVQQEIQPVTLNYLHTLAESYNTLESARYLQGELPRRLARRVKAIQSLPFIVGVNPYIRSVYQLYLDSFDQLRKFPVIETEEDQVKFTEKLKDLVASHQDVIATLAKGFSECGKYMSKDNKTDFLDKMIMARIAIRVLAEHHLALLEPSPDWIGIVHSNFQPAKLVQSVAQYVETLCDMNYGSAPSVSVTGHADTAIPYIPVHVEYILMELMKNAMRATVEHSSRIGRLGHPDIEVTIAKGNEDVTIRIRDEGGGISQSDISKVFEYSFTTVPKYDDHVDNVFATQSRMDMQSGVGGPIAGLGFGLPMSRVYAKYFGGSLFLKSIPGHGCDVFLRLPNISQLATSVQI